MCHSRAASDEGVSRRTRDGGQALGRDLPALLQVERREAGHEGEALQPGILDLVAALQVQLLQGAQALPLPQVGPCARTSTLNAASQRAGEDIAARRVLKEPRTHNKRTHPLAALTRTRRL